MEMSVSSIRDFLSIYLPFKMKWVYIEHFFLQRQNNLFLSGGLFKKKKKVEIQEAFWSFPVKVLEINPNQT